MSEEIKEKLEAIASDDDIDLLWNEANELLNYITNLQKENQSLKEKLNCKEYFSSTMPENTEFVILTKENYDKQQKDLALENIILKSRNEKAVEYIEKNKQKIREITSANSGSMVIYELCCDSDDLLNILQGGDE